MRCEVSGLKERLGCGYVKCRGGSERRELSHERDCELGSLYSFAADLRDEVAVLSQDGVAEDRDRRLGRAQNLCGPSISSTGICLTTASYLKLELCSELTELLVDESDRA